MIFVFLHFRFLWKMSLLETIWFLNCFLFCIFFPESVWAQGSSNSGGLYLIFSSSHLLIFTPSLTPSHLHICSSSHLLIFTSSHLHIFSSSHLLIFTSAHLHICSSSHLLILTSAHLHICSSSHLLILVFWTSEFSWFSDFFWIFCVFWFVWIF